MPKPIYAALLLTASAALVGCGGDAEPPAPVETGIAGLEVKDARMVLPPVSGNPAAIYFELANTGDRGIAIRTAAVEGAASAQIHGTMEWSGEMTMGETGPQSVQPGQTLAFEPGGLHVMAFDLGPEVQEGGQVEVTLTAAGGKTMSFDAAVRGAGDER